MAKYKKNLNTKVFVKRFIERALDEGGWLEFGVCYRNPSLHCYMEDGTYFRSPPLNSRTPPKWWTDACQGQGVKPEIDCLEGAQLRRNYRHGLHNVIATVHVVDPPADQYAALAARCLQGREFVFALGEAEFARDCQEALARYESISAGYDIRV